MRRVQTFSWLWLAALVMLPAAVQLRGQAGQASEQLSRPLTADGGHPSLEGFWDAGTITPLERPDEFADKPSVNEREAAAFVERFFERNSLDWRERDVNPTTGAKSPGGYNEFWVDRGSQLTKVNGKLRTSLIVDPPDGRIPPMTREAQARDEALGGAAARPDIVERRSLDMKSGYFDHPEQRPLAERCLLGFGSTSGPPSLPVLYNNFKQIVQSGNQVMLLNEMAHDARVIRIGGQHPPKSIRRWLGDSIGRWEGNTLVVDTTNFKETRFRGSGPSLRVVERFTRTGPETLLYQFTVEDLDTWSRPWGGEYTWNAATESIFEYACHEANYALPGVLKGAREQEKPSSR